jgi:hypothetical protein
MDGDHTTPSTRLSPQDTTGIRLRPHHHMVPSFGNSTTVTALVSAAGPTSPHTPLGPLPLPPSAIAMHPAHHKLLHRHPEPSLFGSVPPRSAITSRLYCSSRSCVPEPMVRPPGLGNTVPGMFPQFPRGPLCPLFRCFTVIRPR